MFVIYIKFTDKCKSGKLNNIRMKVIINHVNNNQSRYYINSSSNSIWASIAEANTCHLFLLEGGSQPDLLAYISYSQYLRTSMNIYLIYLTTVLVTI